MKSKHAPFIICLFVIIPLVYMGRWAIVESDLFWQIRAGLEILKTGHVQTSDSWSYTIYGQRWINFQWLSTVIAALVSKLSTSMVVFFYWRLILLAVVLSLMAKITLKCSEGVARLWALVIFLPCAFLILFVRFELRPDLYATIIFEALILLWLSDSSDRKKKLGGLTLLILWSQFHAGTAPFGIFLYVLVNFHRRDWLWNLAALASWFLTPIGTDIIWVMKENVIFYEAQKTHNADFAGFSTELLKQAWTYALWPPLTLCAGLSYLFLKLKKSQALPNLYRSAVFFAITALPLTVLAFFKIRSLHYQVIFILPILATGFSAIVNHLVSSPKRPERYLGWATVLVGAGAIWGVLLPSFMRDTQGMHEAEVAAWRFPVQNVEFLLRTQPPGQILNHYNFGGYLIKELPHYPVARDSRDIPYKDFEERFGKAQRTPASYQIFLQDIGAQIILDAYPVVVYDRRTQTQTDLNQIIYPPNDWALVAIDNVSVVLLKRTPQNQTLIAANEYHYLRPGLPADFAMRDKSLAPQVLRGWESEAGRCLSQAPLTSYCLEVKAAFAMSRQDFAAAQRWLALAKKSNPESLGQ